MEFLLVLFIIVIAFRVFFLNILPWIIKRKIQKMQNGFTQQEAQEKSRREGEIHFEKPNKSSNSVAKDNVGEYVDYEEIK